MPDTTPGEAAPRRRGAPKGNLNALKDGAHSASGLAVDLSMLPPDLRRLLHHAMATAVRAEVAAMPHPYTSRDRRAATLRGLRRVYD